MRSCLIVTGGNIDLAFTRSFLRTESFEKVIAADRALDALQKLDMIPDYIVGDMDSASEEAREYYRQYPYIVWDLRSPEKNETDTELARDRALTLGFKRIVILGATGGRIDHLLSNIDALYGCLMSGVEAYIVDEQNRISLTDGVKTFRKEDRWGKYVSFIPFSGEVKDVTLTGFKYPLSGHTLRRGEDPGLCISNEIVKERAKVKITGGVLICVESGDGQNSSKSGGSGV